MEDVSEVGPPGKIKSKTNEMQERWSLGLYITVLSLSTQFYVACNLISSTMNSIALKPSSLSLALSSYRKAKAEKNSKRGSFNPYGRI
jgi:hypothetical protein